MASNATTPPNTRSYGADVAPCTPGSDGYHGPRMSPRTVMLSAALVLTFAALAVPATQADSLLRDRTAPQLVGLRAYTLSPQKYAGDRRLFVTISPNGDGVRDMAKISFTLTERATVRLRIARTLSRPEVIYEKTATFGPGRHVFNWSPDPTTAPRTYLTLLDVRDAAGNRRTYGAANAETGRRPTAPVIRVLGVEAGFTRESYVPGETATLAVESDASAPVAAGLPRRARGRSDVQRHADERRPGDGAGERRLVGPRSARHGPGADRSSGPPGSTSRSSPTRTVASASPPSCSAPPSSERRASR